MTAVYPWRTNSDLHAVLAAAKPVFAALSVIEPSGGSSDEEIAAAERRLTSPLPPEVRQFHRIMRPTDIFTGEKVFGFYGLESPELTWRSMRDAEPAEDWTSARGLALGQSVYGDAFWWVEGHRIVPTGGIVLLDHDCALGGDVLFVYYARSFREFIAKLTCFKDLYSLDPLFRQQYLELNPSAKL